MDDVLKIAKNCRHYAMCKIDYLGSGVCASGLEKHYVSFYPEGRMDLYAAIAEKTIPITEKCVEIADSCNLCGKCDYQCYFVMELRPSKVMKALKDHVGAYLESGGKIVPAKDDRLLAEMKGIVGDDWATNDPAVRITYHHDLCPHVTFKMPEYVVMPNSIEEISAIVKLLNKNKIPYVVRGNGASSHGLVFSEGAVLDLNRMKTMDFDEKNWLVKVGPGIAAFDLQWEAKKRGARVHTAEPALAPSPAQLTQDVDPDLSPFFEELYSRPEMTDLVWLNTFRIMSSRYNREKPCVALVCYLPIDTSLIEEIQGRFQDIARKHHLKSALGFITPIDSGKRCVWEHDFYFDHNDPAEVLRIQQAAYEAGALIDDYSLKTGTIRQVRYVVNQGCCRKENLLYS
ncbi:MAG: FAD-dependent oxidoreductase [Acidobacteria bacterium]|nr:FAD-dependent oxidoreductase [Acidobacteriota bacterium]